MVTMQAIREDLRQIRYPARIPISERQDANSVEMAVGYDEEGKPNDYANIPLKL